MIMIKEIKIRIEILKEVKRIKRILILNNIGLNNKLKKEKQKRKFLKESLLLMNIQEKRVLLNAQFLKRKYILIVI